MKNKKQIMQELEGLKFDQRLKQRVDNKPAYFNYKIKILEALKNQLEDFEKVIDKRVLLLESKLRKEKKMIEVRNLNNLKVSNNTQLNLYWLEEQIKDWKEFKQKITGEKE